MVWGFDPDLLFKSYTASIITWSKSIRIPGTRWRLTLERAQEDELRKELMLMELQKRKN